jgi:hypothetical protein
MADPVTMTLMAAGTAMSAYGSYREGESAVAAGKANRDAAYNEAKGLDIQAQQEIAVGSHNSKTIGLRAKEILARQQAEAAAGGGSTQDGTVVAIANETVKSSSLEQLLQMAAAEETAQQLVHKGQIVRRGGDQALADARESRRASRLKAATTLVQGGASWGQMFGGMGGGSAGSANAASSGLHSGKSNAAPW